MCSTILTVCYMPVFKPFPDFSSIDYGSVSDQCSLAVIRIRLVSKNLAIPTSRANVETFDCSSLIGLLE